MAFGSPARVFIVYFAAMVVAAAAAKDPNMPGMDMPPAPAPSATTMVSPSAVVGGFVALALSYLMIKERVYCNFLPE
ncbi:hypothetical protein L1987_72815 [Smallanthus sonchifolius]|uniref:Uncharacterized protein n=1 Tax=Smallanthus sonchifolius TaxID=185202 RepID=A0ACB9AWY7_9ASTR|nr:hypothetical protein L1987_72815 [Smallanthus sonchifolius]